MRRRASNLNKRTTTFLICHAVTRERRDTRARARQKYRRWTSFCRRRRASGRNAVVMRAACQRVLTRKPCYALQARSAREEAAGRSCGGPVAIRDLKIARAIPRRFEGNRFPPRARGDNDAIVIAEKRNLARERSQLRLSISR